MSARVVPCDNASLRNDINEKGKAIVYEKAFIGVIIGHVNKAEANVHNRNAGLGKRSEVELLGTASSE